MPALPSREEYRRIRKPEGEKEKNQGPENEIRVTAKHGQRSYIAYAIALLRGEDGRTQHDTIKISAMGAAIHSAVNIAEIVKRRVIGLHQTADISSEVIQDEYEAINEKKDNIIVDRKVSTILITLSLKPLDSTHIGYQSPLPVAQVKEQEDREPGEPRENTRGRGGRGSRGGRSSGRGSRRGGGGGGGGSTADVESRGRRENRGGRGMSRGGRGGSGSERRNERQGN